MNDTYDCRIAGCLFNLLQCDDYGRKEFLCRQFEISRSSLYRYLATFKELFSAPGRPKIDEKELMIKSLRNELEAVQRRNERLEEELAEARAKHELSIRRLTFLLIAVGLSGRVIAWIHHLALGIRSNHTDILKLAQQYAARATEIMHQHFHSRATVVAVDEVFVDGLPVFVAVAPQSMLICNAGIYDRRTEENWTSFFNEMQNLTGTVSDRGLAILAAVGNRSGHSHQSDVFHCMHTVMKELLKMEKRCYSLIRKEEELQVKLQKQKDSGRDARKAAAALRAAQRPCLEAIELFDNLEQAAKMGFEALAVSLGIAFNTPSQAREDLDFVCEWIRCIHPSWKKVISAFKDQNLLNHLNILADQLRQVQVETSCPFEREYILAVLTRLWEEQAPRRWRGKPVHIPEVVWDNLQQSCSNLDEVRCNLFDILEQTPKSSSAVECVNSRIGFFRYSKKRFNDDFINFVSVIHNLTPFLDGKRRGRTPAQIDGVDLTTNDLFEIFSV